jgi:hypothetical protein
MSSSGRGGSAEGSLLPKVVPPSRLRHTSLGMWEKTNRVTLTPVGTAWVWGIIMDL